MALKLKRGTELIFAVKQNEAGAYVIEQRLAVGSRAEPRAKAVVLRTEEDLWTWWLQFGDEQLARVGLEKTQK